MSRSTFSSENIHSTFPPHWSILYSAKRNSHWQKNIHEIINQNKKGKWSIRKSSIYIWAVKTTHSPAASVFKNHQFPNMSSKTLRIDCYVDFWIHQFSTEGRNHKMKTTTQPLILKLDFIKFHRKKKLNYWVQVTFCWTTLFIMSDWDASLLKYTGLHLTYEIDI